MRIAIRNMQMLTPVKQYRPFFVVGGALKQAFQEH